MIYDDTNFNLPSKNIAYDEALLNRGEEVLRLWHSQETMVVLGKGNVADREANVDVCAKKEVPIFKRCSGGGAVVLGQGCLNYALVLDIEKRPECRSITSTNDFVMNGMKQALNDKDVQVEGYTDLVYKGRKFSGNSQRRLKHFLLFHGTFLLDFDLSVISDLLSHPSREPHYRQGRSHEDFLCCYSRDESDVRSALKSFWLD